MYKFSFTVIVDGRHYLPSLQVFYTEREARKAMQDHLNSCCENGFNVDAFVHCV